MPFRFLETGESRLDGLERTRPTPDWMIIVANKTLRHKDLEPGHPGDLLAAIVIPAIGKTKIEIAQLPGVSRQTLYDILVRRQSVTPAVAVRLGKLFGNGPDIWLRMQQAYDLWHAERKLEAELRKSKRCAPLRARLPHPPLTKII